MNFLLHMSALGKQPAHFAIPPQMTSSLLVLQGNALTWSMLRMAQRVSPLRSALHSSRHSRLSR